MASDVFPATPTWFGYGSPEQVAAFTAVGRINGVMAASYLFNDARITRVLQCSKAMVDLAG